MGTQSETRLYVDMQSTDPESDLTLAKNVLESYWENRRLHDAVDKIKEKSIRFVHQDHWDEDVEAQRTSVGLPSIVADKTLSIWKTLDGYARRNKKDIKFVQVGSDDFLGSKLHNKIHAWIKNSKSLHHYQSECYGMSSICDESYFYIQPEHNGMGQIDPDFSVQDAFECYPDPNFKDPIEMLDAEFIDIPFWINPKRVMSKFKGFVDKEFEEKMNDYNPNQAFNDDRPRNTYKNRDGQTITSSNGLILGIKRLYKKYYTKKYIVDDKGNILQEYTTADKKYITKKMIDTMGMSILEKDVEELWECVILPEITEHHFVYNQLSDFQPIHPNKLGKMRWPVVRLPFTQVAGKAVGAIRGAVSIQEMRNLILSALMHHLQTAANGGMFYEESAFAGDEVEEEKFKTKRNQAGNSIKVADNALKEKRIGFIPKGETAFQDGGAYLESVFDTVMQDISGAKPVMEGSAQKGSPAALYEMQVQQSQNQLLSSTEYFNQFQDVVAEILYCFTRQFWTEERILMIEGTQGQDPEQLNLMQATANGYLNDPGKGLYTVYKTSAPATETDRRQRLADSLQVSKGLADIGLPTFVQDLTDIVENLENTSRQNKDSMLLKIKQWQANQGILDEAGIQAQQAQAMAAQAQATGGQPVPAGPPRS